MIFGSEDVLPLYGLLKTYFMIVTKMTDYFKGDDDSEDVDKYHFECYYRDKMIAQFDQDLYSKNVFLQDQGECDENDTLQKRIEFWLKVIVLGGPLPDNVYEYDDNNRENDFYFRGSGVIRSLETFKKS